MHRVLWIFMILAVSLTTWLVYQNSVEEPGEQVSQPGRDDGYAFDRFQLEGFAHTEFREGRKLFTLSCRKITHRKRKIGPVTVNPVKEIKMSEVHIELFPQAMRDLSDDSDDNPAQHAEEDPTPIISEAFVEGVKKMLGDRELGFVSRILMADLTLDVFTDQGKQTRIHADRAALGAEFPDATFDKGFSIAAQNGQRLVANKATWDQDKRAFHIPKSYALSDGKGQRRASNAFFGIDAAGRIVQVP